MNKEDIANKPSLSCVENYFLGYFEKKFDIRMLYVSSFMNFNKVINMFLKENIRYENFPLIRVQDLSEKLGFTDHIRTENFICSANCLNLIRVNEKFFNDSKLSPWRPDHYIMIEKDNDQYKYLNNYPLSSNFVCKNFIYDIFDQDTIIYNFKNRFYKKTYKRLKDEQLLEINNEKVELFDFNENDLEKLRDALITLKTLRKRVFEWVEIDRYFINGFDYNYYFLNKNSLIKQYEFLINKIQYQLIRKKTNLDLLKKEVKKLVEIEDIANKMIKKRW